MDHSKLWKILKVKGIPDHLNCLLRNLYAGQEATVRIRNGEMDWFKIGKGVRQGYILSLISLTCRVSCEMQGWKQKLGKIAGRNNNLRYADDITLMAESKEELKSFLMKVKEKCEKAALKLNIQKMKIMAPGPITSWQIDGERMEAVTDSYFFGLQNHCGW